MITLIGSEKGGTGKTTIAVNLAIMLAINSKDVLLIDTDKQPSANQLFQLRDEYGIEPRVTCIQKYGKNLAKDALDLSQRYEHIVIDAGGRDSAELRYSLGIADMGIIPIKPNQIDIWTLERMDMLVYQARSLNPDLRAEIVLNMVSTNVANTDANDAAQIISEFENMNLLETRLKERVAYQRSIRTGKSVVEYEPKDTKAIEELASLFKEVSLNGH